MSSNKYCKATKIYRLLLFLLVVGIVPVKANTAPLMPSFWQEQAITVSGIVSDEGGLPMPGVGIRVKGTTISTVTDKDGRFTVESDANSTLVFSFIGYTTQEVPLNGRTSLNVRMAETAAALSEVVVIGYGTVRRSDLTGSIASVKGADIKSEGVSDITRSLQGKMPGVSIEASGGDPGSGTRILIRGVGTLGNAAPLYIVDGVQVANINNLNQTDIESVDVLKDASAAAIYGSRAANGVVLVTTKSGKSGPPVVQVTANVGVQNKASSVDVLNAREWAIVSNQASANAGLPPLEIAQNPDQLGEGTDWQ